VPVDPDDEEGRSDDGPTMAVASPLLSARPLRDDLANPRPLAKTAFGLGPSAPALAGLGGMSGGVDKDAETMSFVGDELPAGENDVEETTRAVSREELIRHQDAQLIVGDDAHGDEATLAVAPGQIEGLDPAIAAALSNALKQREPARQPPQDAPGPPAFPPPQSPFPGSSMQGGSMEGGSMQGGSMGGSSGHLPAAPPASQSFANAPPPQSWGGQGMPPSFDPMLPQHQGGYPPPSNPNPGVQQTQNMTGGPNPHQATAVGPGGGPPSQQMPMQHQPMQQQQLQQRGMANPQAWMTQPSPPPAAMTGPSRFTPQVILLVAVGVVCLAIFIIGIVLFVTTKF